MTQLIFKSVLVWLFFISSLFGLDFKVASYNVENLFDLNNDGTEYSEFVPNKTNWNKETLDIKLKNISQVINELNADIIALQEIESQAAIELLVSKLPQYKYHTFIKNPRSAVGVGIISKYEIINTNSIEIDARNNYSRPILEADIKIENQIIKLFVNHWRSKSAAESSRIPYAKALYKRILTLEKHIDYIILGDFNSNYDEFETFKYDKKLNDTHGITAINDVLKTSIKGEFITKSNILDKKEIVHYNLWLELPFYERYSYKFKGTPNTPDSIIISSALFDEIGISYIDGSFGVFKPEYLYKKGHIQRWEMDKKGFHRKRGYSDHLPIFAMFTTNKTIKANHQKNIHLDKISSLYSVESLKYPAKLSNVIVLYKTQNSAIIKQQNDRAIFVYNSAKDLKVGQAYDITVDKISLFYGQKQISNISSYTPKGDFKEYKKLFIDGSKSDLFDFNIQNEIITNIKGEYIKRDLHYNDKKIRIYAKDKNILPPQNSNILIKSAHLGSYNNIPQLILYSKDDYEIIK